MMKNTHIHLLLAVFTVFFFVACKKNKATAEKKDALKSDQVSVPADHSVGFQEKFFQAMSEKSRSETEKAYATFGECLLLDPNNGVVNYEMARMDRVAHNDPNAALDHIKKALIADQKNNWYHLEMAEVYMAMGKYDLALKSYKEVEKIRPDDTSILFEEANVYLLLGKKEEAIKVFDQLEKRNGPNEELSFQKHDLYMQIKDYSKAGLELEKLAIAFPEEPKYWGITAQFYQQMHEPEKAKLALEKMKTADPNNGQVHYQLSEYYAAAGDNAKSYDELKLAFETLDISIDQKISILLKYFSLTDRDLSYLPQAYELLALTTKLHPKEAKAHSIYGDFLFRDKKDKEALDMYREAIKLDESRNLIWSQILVIDSELKLYTDMEKESARAMELFPTLPEFYYFNGLANERLKKYSKAAESLQLGKELVIDNDRLSLQFYSSLGTVYHQLQMDAKSDEAFDAALRLDPKNAFVLNNYAYYLSLRKVKLTKAAEMASLCNELAPGTSSFQDTFAWVLYQQGKYQEALSWAEKAAISSGNYGDVLEHLGDILFRLGKKDDALYNWKKAQQQGVHSEELQQKIIQQRIAD